MARILSIDSQTQLINIGMDNGTIQQVHQSVFTFVPQIGMDVDVYWNEHEIHVYQKQANQQQVIVQNISHQQPIYKNKHRVNKATYLVCALFLGGLGIHKFVASRPVQGIFYLLFSWTWIPLIISLCEFIIVCFYKKDEYGMISV